MPTRHDSTIFLDKIMLLYYTMKIPVNVSKIICQHIVARVKHPRGVKHFLHLIEQLCIKAYPELEKFPQIAVKDGICTAPTFFRVIAIQRNKEKPKCLKTKQEGKTKVDSEVELEKEEEEKRKEDHIPLKRKRQGEKESSRSKKVKTTKAKDSSDPSSLVLAIIPNDQTPTKTISP